MGGSGNQICPDFERPLLEPALDLGVGLPVKQEVSRNL